ncbi:hypothetical protein RJ639_044108 [Escallonia herrerae]|uniref:Iron hydrogenase large subunit C-terminal domain-containing protein n=1 Tax=Escallonia herrerae TaxID=1293975 RepID=A0AA88WDG6_9ASTE|nr:hypothetical protein RJ639_044108 [Escallonia herrerae]
MHFAVSFNLLIIKDETISNKNEMCANVSEWMKEKKKIEEREAAQAAMHGVIVGDFHGVSRLGFSITEPVIWLLALLDQSAQESRQDQNMLSHPKLLCTLCALLTLRRARPEEVYHVTVMPCYDKKLEAAREDFVFQVEHLDETQKNTVLETTEVDSVLTSGEVLELIQSTSIDFGALEESAPDKLLTNVDEEGNLFGVSGSSGGYADTIFRHTAKVLYGREIKGPLEFKTKRNTDFREVSLEGAQFGLEEDVFGCHVCDGCP